MFIHDAVLESLICGDTQIPASGLVSAIEKLKQRDSETGRTGFETQFHVRCSGITTCVPIHPITLCDFNPCIWLLNSDVGRCWDIGGLAEPHGKFFDFLVR